MRKLIFIILALLICSSSVRAQEVLSDFSDKTLPVLNDELAKLKKEANWSLAYPVGSIYISTVSTNPATLFGFGTWTAFGAGKVLVGLNGSDVDFDTAEETGGAKTVTLTAAQSGVPAHTHVQSVYTAVSGSNVSTAKTNADTTGNTASASVTQANTAADASSAHTNVQPYIVVYMWERTS